VEVVWFYQRFFQGWRGHWHDVSREELEKLEIEGLLERSD